MMQNVDAKIWLIDLANVAGMNFPDGHEVERAARALEKAIKQRQNALAKESGALPPKHALNVEKHRAEGWQIIDGNNGKLDKRKAWQNHDVRKLYCSVKPAASGGSRVIWAVKPKAPQETEQ